MFFIWLSSRWYTINYECFVFYRTYDVMRFRSKMCIKNVCIIKIKEKRRGKFPIIYMFA